MRTLLDAGYRILAVNYHSRYGEIDVIAADLEMICFVEVKTRREKALVAAEESVTPAKQIKILKTALSYIAETGCGLQPRFDVFCVITGADGGVVRHDHIKGAFDGEAYKNY